MAALPAWPPADSRLKSLERSLLPITLHPGGENIARLGCLPQYVRTVPGPTGVGEN